MTTRAVFLATFVFLAACASAPDVQTTADPGADPAKYQTFAFAQGDPNAKGAITDRLVNDRLRQMIAEQMVSRGYIPAAPGQAGELAVHFAGHVEPKQQVYVVGRSGVYGYGWGRTELGGYDTVDYRQGTLFVDLFHVGDQKLLWRARISEALTTSYSEENWTKVRNALAEAFKSLPARR